MSDQLRWRVLIPETERVWRLASKEEAETKGKELLQQFGKEKHIETRTVLMYRSSGLEMSAAELEAAVTVGQWDPDIGLVDEGGHPLDL